eukprot:Plantae.Rhodophyta-Rhodochaete_pulchella.ctg6236.p1 GENE.Plantae.Rhodophyta-Rhodochaete_pulchella.ctg6236~~Plantae.Rhodophyta-Rhodochaete_pulchella.ctg6236.p1  ORF type:complete len:492 (+),score=38.80 Plantae.Rhodophyta-Rhodochaete_pulchella.ctg6236:1935-3410(+)
MLPAAPPDQCALNVTSQKDTVACGLAAREGRPNKPATFRSLQMLASGVEIASLLYRAYLRLLGTRSQRTSYGSSSTAPIYGGNGDYSSVVPIIVRLGSVVNQLMSKRRAELESGEWESRYSRNGRVVCRSDFAASLLYWIPFADAATCSSVEEVLQTCGRGVESEDILHFKPTAVHLEPGYLVVRDRGRRSIVCVVRSTQSVADVMTDLTVETEPFLGDYGHRGIVASAKHMADRTMIPELMRRHVRDGMEFVLVGHSLGAAVAMALAMYLKTKTSVPQRISCIAFSPPPFLGRRLAKQAIDPSLICVVNGFDVVPRLSVASLERTVAQLERKMDQSSLYSSVLEPYVGSDIATNVQRYLPTILGAWSDTASPSLSSSSTPSSTGAWNTWESVGAAAYAAALAFNLPVGWMGNLGRSGRPNSRTRASGAGRELRIPGQIYHIYRTSSDGPVRILSNLDADVFADLEIADTMISDHFTRAIRNALESFASEG